MDNTWISTNMANDMPPDMIIAGYDTNGDVIYVGRAYHNGDILPAKVIPNKKTAYVSWGGIEHVKHDVEILIGHHYEWAPATVDSVPSNAICVGKTNDGEPLFMGRVKWEDSMTPGKIQVSHNCLYIPYGGNEYRIVDNYEILVQLETWMSVSGNDVPNGAVYAGRDVDGDVIFVGRATHEGELLPAKAIPNKGCAYVSYGGHEYLKYDYEILVGNYFEWLNGSNGTVPENAFVCGQTSDGESLYVGRGEWCTNLTPGKIHPSHGCLYIPFGEQEIRLNEYEVLVKRSCYKNLIDNDGFC